MNRCVARYVFENRLEGDFVKFPSKEAYNYVRRIKSAEREWRKVLQENPHLRGSDYGDKDRLEAEKQIELGYYQGGNTTHKRI